MSYLRAFHGFFEKCSTENRTTSNRHPECFSRGSEFRLDSGQKHAGMTDLPESQNLEDQSETPSLFLKPRLGSCNHFVVKIFLN